MKKILLISLIGAGCVKCTYAQEAINKKVIDSLITESRHQLWDRGSSFTAQSNLFNEIDLSSYELLSANLSFTDKDQTQKIVLSPFKLLNNTQRMGMLVNTKINVALKDKFTTIGIGFASDNSAYFSRRAGRIRAKIFYPGSIKVPGAPQPVPANYELFVQELIGRLLDSTAMKSSNDPAVVARIRNINQASMDSLVQYYHKPLLQAVFDKYQKEELVLVNKVFDSLLLQYDKQMASSVFKWSVGYNFQLFPNLFSQGDANDFDSLNYHNMKSHNISGSITYSLNNNCWVFTAGYNHIYAFSNAEKTQKKVPYYGPALLVSKRVWTLVSSERLDTMAAYKKSLFVPSINIGLTFEGKYADGSVKYVEYYQDKMKRTVSWMPFVDLLISPALQFRIGIPITRMRFPTGEKQTFTGANIQYNFKLSNLAL